MQKPITVGLFGAPGFNLGDNAISDCMIDGLSAAYHNVRFFVGAADRNYVCHKDRTTTFYVDRKSIRGVIRLFSVIRNCDVVVLGGGSLIQDLNGGSRIRGILGYAWTVTLIAKFTGKKIMSAPIGVDDLMTKVGVRAAKEIFGRMEWICLRDGASFKNAQRLLGRRWHKISFVSQVCDPAFGLIINEHIDSVPVARIVSLAPAFEGKNVQAIAEIFAACITEIAENFEGVLFNLLAMDSRNIEDAGHLRSIVDSVPKALQERITIMIPPDVLTAAAVLRSSFAVVSMRLHALILAYGYTKLFCISRSEKTDSLAENLSIASVKFGPKANAPTIAKLVVNSLAREDLSNRRESLARMRAQLAEYYSLLASKISSHRSTH